MKAEKIKEDLEFFKKESLAKIDELTTKQKNKINKTIEFFKKAILVSENMSEDTMVKELEMANKKKLYIENMIIGLPEKEKNRIKNELNYSTKAEQVELLRYILSK